MTRRNNALLTVAVLLPVSAAAAAVDAPLAPLPVVLGVVVALSVEALLTWRARTVERLWRARTVRVAAVVTTFVGAAVGVASLGAWALTAVVAGLVTYLLLLGVAEWGHRLPT